MSQAGGIVRRWLELSAALVDRHAAELTALDAAIGDGDHGINLQRGFAAVSERLDTDVDGASGADLLRLAGRTLVSTVGGAAGPLYGTYLLQLATELDGAARLDPGLMADALERAADAVGRRGRSTTGEKTMLDALVPAAIAWRAAAAADGSLAECAAAAAAAAEAGRAGTAPMVATKGRASYLGERSRGHVDPGATSATLLMVALDDAIGQAGAGDGAGEGRSR